MSKIFVNCGGQLDVFNDKKEVMDFYEDCILMSEGSERERYTNIYFEVKTHLKDDQICFTDGTDRVYMSKIDPDDITTNEERQLRECFGIDKTDLLKLKIMNELSEHSYIYPSILKRYEDNDDLYEDYLSKSKDYSFYFFDNDRIVCIDTLGITNDDKYFIEEFPLEDYKYADKWLKKEIEYTDYLEEKNQDMEI